MLLPRKIWLDALVSFMTILSLTQVISYLASRVSLSFSTVGMLWIGVYAVYLLVNAQTLPRLFRSKMVFFWLALFFAWPLVSFLYSPLSGLREMGIVVLCCETSLYVLVMAAKYGFRPLGAVAGICFLVSIAGGVVSVLYPAFFNEMAFNYLDKQNTLGNTASIKENFEVMSGRAYGFFLQPNVLAAATVFFFAVWAAFSQTKYMITKAVAMLLCLFGVLITASRGGLLLFLLCAFLFGLYYLLYGMPLKAKTARPMAVLGTHAVILVAGLFAFVVLAPFIFKSESFAFALKGDTPLARIEKFMTGKVNIRDDDSMSSRLDVAEQAVHMLFSDYPMGLGYNGMMYLYMSGDLMMDVHNLYLRFGLDYGVFYLALYLLFLVLLLFARSPPVLPGCHLLRVNLAGTWILYGFMSHSAIEGYFVHFLIGCILALMICPEMARPVVPNLHRPPPPWADNRRQGPQLGVLVARNARNRLVARRDT